MCLSLGFWGAEGVIPMDHLDPSLAEEIKPSVCVEHHSDELFPEESLCVLPELAIRCPTWCIMRHWEEDKWLCWKVDTDRRRELLSLVIYLNSGTFPFLSQ
jgi:hypothetical protein